MGYAPCTEHLQGRNPPRWLTFRQADSASLTLERLAWSKLMGVGGEKVGVAGSDGDH